MASANSDSSVAPWRLLFITLGCITTLSSIICNIIASRLPGYRCLIILISILFTMACAICLWKLPQTNRVALLGPYYALYSYCTMCTSLPMANTSGYTKKVTMNAMFFLRYCVENILGPRVFQAKDAPSYHNSYIGLLASLVVGAVSIAIYGLLCKFANARQDKMQGGGPLPQTEDRKRFRI